MDLKYECDLRWDDLGGESHMRRHCGECDQNVYNISNMTKDQAERLIRLHEGSGKRLCVNFVRSDGRIVHKGDPMSQFEQVQKQRSGATKLMATALLIHTGLAAVSDNPRDYFFDPLLAIADAVSSLVDKKVEPKFSQSNYQTTGIVF